MFCVVELEYQWVQSQGQIRALPLLGRIFGLADLVDLVELYGMPDPRITVSGRHPVVCLWCQLASEWVCTNQVPQRGHGRRNTVCLQRSWKILTSVLVGKFSLVGFMILLGLMLML